MSKLDAARAGVLIHRLGDTFLHRQIDNELKLYSSDEGHLHDSINPDQIFLRPELFSDYLSALSQVLNRLHGRVHGWAIAEEDLDDVTAPLQRIADDSAKEFRRNHKGQERKNIADLLAQGRDGKPAPQAEVDDTLDTLEEAIRPVLSEF